MKIDRGIRRLVLAIGIVIFLICTIGVVDRFETKRTERVFTAIAEADEEFSKGTNSLQAQENYLLKLRAIDTSFTEQGLERAFIEYRTAFENLLSATKTGNASAALKEELRLARSLLLNRAWSLK